MSFNQLPAELHLMIAAHVTDPCDLLALRLTHPSLNCLLSERFARTFPPTVCTWNNENIFTMIHWAAEHNHRRFMNKKLLKTNASLGISHVCFDDLQSTSLHAARLGNVKMMFDILDYTYFQGDSHLSRRLYHAHDQFRLCTLIRKKTAAPSWQDNKDSSLFMMAVEEHRLDLADLVFRSKSAWGWIPGLGSVDVDPTVEIALASYIEARVDGHISTWCQKALFVLLKGQNLFAPVPISEEFVCYLRTAERRECGPECGVWFGGNKKLDNVKLILELRKLQRSEYSHLMWGN